MDTISMIWWAGRHTPQLLKTLLLHGWEYLLGRMPAPPEAKGVEVKSPIGRFVYEFFSQPAVLHSLNVTMLPWGQFSKNSGRSMQPTLPGSPAVTYMSFDYVDERDLKVGDVVTVIPPDYDKHGRRWCKRIAALSGDRIWVEKLRELQNQIVRVRLCSCHQSSQ